MGNTLVINTSLHVISTVFKMKRCQTFPLEIAHTPSSCLIGQTVVSLQQNAACLHPHSNAGTTCNSDLMYIYVQEWQIYAYAHICTVRHCPSLELFNDPIEERRAVVSYRSLLGDQHAFDRKHKRCIDQNHQSNGSNPPTFCH